MVKTWEQLEEMQPNVLKMLKNSIVKGRVAHAYLFEGMRGTGKREASLLLAKILFCENRQKDVKPCESCVNCKRINSGNHPDVHIVEPEGQSIKKEQIRLLQEEFSKTGLESRKKLYTIVHADKMTINAANSLLKFLEEPHSDTVAILLTEQVQKILPTIHSRCQIVSFKPLVPEILQNKLISNGVHPSKALLLAHLTNNFEEALSLSKDEWFAQAQKIVLKLYEELKKKPLEAMVMLQVDWNSHFKEKEQLDQGLNLLLLVYKDILNIQLGKFDHVVYQDYKHRFEQHALQTTGLRLAEQMTAILEAKRKLQANVNLQLLMEQLVIKLQEGSSFV
ncbi:DNA polymerase III subunit delta' [Bacillus aquiflavi]|uniref:DNA polymerase III subunit delta' n=1 Tax=Bacillus aquiflavi TaxID=2672567 RepID=A0A6B3VTW1_9BACI|nr:DNA polymerase III subunit delta' [Bacillus aquiflavi]MBA4537465.1 DNA polymerase III subunit delta' [Bacillus aquiflavi]NEY81720.1 DNA polymerase III subunit delta' [Bacillus aquiflavi]UAC48211.1 DNA polymerase III subunit delta' [Bacillus aquiflavi]